MHLDLAKVVMCYKKEFMKSLYFHKYGTAEDLEIHDVSKPSCSSNEVLVKIHAASVNDWDWVLLRGKPFVNRLLFGFLKPKVKTLGVDISGVVEFTGSNVSKFKIGDEVLGDISGYNWGGFAEYVCVKETFLELKPSKMTFEEAAAIPQAGVLGIQGFKDKTSLAKKQNILINGAGGGSGTFAIQIAKNLGLHVTGVDKSTKFETMRSLGADHVIDYTKEDFTEKVNHYDIILDFAGHHPFFHYKRALNKNGIYLLVGGSSSLIIKCLLLGPILSLFGTKKLQILPHKPNKYLGELIRLKQEGKLKVVIDRVFELQKAPQALEYFGTGEAIGKIVISMRKTAQNNTYKQ